MSNVEPIHKGILVHERAVDKDAVELLEEMLEMARSGELIGFAGAMLFYDGVAARRRAGASSYGLIGAVAAQAHVLTMEWLQR